MTEYEAHKSYLTKHIVSNEGLILKCVLKQPATSFHPELTEHTNWTCNKCGWGIDNESYWNAYNINKVRPVRWHKDCGDKI